MKNRSLFLGQCYLESDYGWIGGGNFKGSGIEALPSGGSTLKIYFSFRNMEKKN